MAKIYESLLSTNILQEKRQDSFDPQRENLLGEDTICMYNLMEIPRVIVFVFLLDDCLHRVKKGVSVFRKSSGKSNLNVAGTFPQGGYDVKREREK